MTMVLSLFPIRIKNTIVCFRASRERVSRQTGSPFATTRIGARDSTTLFLVLSLETSPERIFRARDWAFIFPLSPSRRYEFSQRLKNERRRNPKTKNFTFEIYPLPQRRERHSIRQCFLRASHGFREGRASGGNRGRRLDGKHIYM
jgi:hypothetical protein